MDSDRHLADDRSSGRNEVPDDSMSDRTEALM